MDYGRRKYATPTDNQIGFMRESTDQYVNSIGGDYYPHADTRQPYLYSDYTEMLYLFNGPGLSPYINDHKDPELKPVNWGKPPSPGNPGSPGRPQPGQPGTFAPPGFGSPGYGSPSSGSPNYGAFGSRGYGASGSGSVDMSLGDFGLDEGQGDGTFSWWDLCGGLGISYTSNSLGADEEMSISAGAVGENINLSWSLSGVGSLKNEDGGALTEDRRTIVYTAPHTNPGCDNPIITLRCEGRVTNIIKIAVNTSTSGSAAAVVKTCYNGSETCAKNCGCYSVAGIAYKCTGGIVVGGSCGTSTPGCVNFGPPPLTYPTCALAFAAVCVNAAAGQCNSCAAALAFCSVYAGGLGTTDLRTAEMIADGCCPSQLL